MSRPVIPIASLTWECGYCSYRTLCSATEAGRIPVESVVTIGAVA